LSQVGVKKSEIQPEVLNTPLTKFHVLIAETLADRLAVFLSQREHLFVCIHAYDAPRRAGDLRSDVADFACSRTEVEHGVALTDVPRWIAAAVIALFDLVGDDAQVLRIVFHRAAQFRLALPCCLTVSLSHHPL